MFTQTDLDRLDAAIASGVLTVSTDTDTITYQSMAALMKARGFVATQLAAQNDSRRAGFIRHQVASFE